MSGPALGRAKPRGFVLSGFRTAPLVAALTAVRLVVGLLVGLEVALVVFLTARRRVMGAMAGALLAMVRRGLGVVRLDEGLLLRPLVEERGRDHRDEAPEDFPERHLVGRQDPIRTQDLG